VTDQTNIEQWTEWYVALRDKVRAFDDRISEERKKLTEPMQVLEGRIQKFLSESNIESLKTKAGTCYVSTRYTASVADGEAFMNYVKDGHWDLIERRANATAVRDFVKEHNHLPAGVNLTALQSVGVRRPTTKKD
jgi:hypothetical protein